MRHNPVQAQVYNLDLVDLELATGTTLMQRIKGEFFRNRYQNDTAIIVRFCIIEII